MSESNKFTPGPWEVVEDIRYENTESQYTAGFDIFNFDGVSVVGCEGISGDSEKERANAILIAAAPDLLEALENLYRDSMASDFNEHWDSYKLAGLAIIKARGQQ